MTIDSGGRVGLSSKPSRNLGTTLVLLVLHLITTGKDFTTWRKVTTAPIEFNIGGNMTVSNSNGQIYLSSTLEFIILVI